MSSPTRIWHVYLLLCADGTLYTGIALDPQRRTRAHNAGRGSRYTRTRLPVRLLASKPIGTQQQALMLERHIKRYGPAQKKKTFGIGI